MGWDTAYGNARLENALCEKRGRRDCVAVTGAILAGISVGCYCIDHLQNAIMAKQKRATDIDTRTLRYSSPDKTLKEGGAVYNVTKDFQLPLSGKYGAMTTGFSFRERNDGLFHLYKGDEQSFLAIGISMIEKHKDSLTLNK